jgi:hypothetical protein
VTLEEPEALLPGAQALASQAAVDRAGSHSDPTHPELIRDPLGTPSRLRESLGQDPALDRSVQFGRPSRTGLAVLRVQAVSSVAAEAVAQLVVGRAGDPSLPAGLRDAAELLSSAEEAKAKSVYPVFEGHRDIDTRGG